VTCKPVDLGIFVPLAKSLFEWAPNDVPEMHLHRNTKIWLKSDLFDLLFSRKSNRIAYLESKLAELTNEVDILRGKNSHYRLSGAAKEMFNKAQFSPHIHAPKLERSASAFRNGLHQEGESL
jgi:hypothetical protein